MFIRIKNTYFNLNTVYKVYLVEDTINFIFGDDKHWHFAKYENAEEAKDVFNKFGHWLSYKQANESVFVFQKD